MREDDWHNIVRYLTAFQTEGSETMVSIAFERMNYEPALSSSVELPGRITIQEPQQDAIFSRQDQISVVWNPSNSSQDLRIQVSTTCQSGEDMSTRSESFTIPDSGIADFAIDDLLDEWELEVGATCTAVIKLIRNSTGEISPEFRGGSITATSTASVSININP